MSDSLINRLQATTYSIKEVKQNVHPYLDFCSQPELSAHIN